MRFTIPYYFACALSLTLATNAYSQEVLIKAPSGAFVSMDIEPEETFFNVIQQIETFIDASAGDDQLYAHQEPSEESFKFCLDYSSYSNESDAMAPRAAYRNYSVPVTPQEKADMSYIVNTLAKNSLMSIYSQKDDLERAGDRFSNVHPFRFLMTLFQDESLKVCVRNIRDRRDLGRKDIWNNFVKGFTVSFNEEVANNNVDQHVDSFAQSLGLKGTQIRPYVQGRQWEAMIMQLIDLLPRKGDSGRYDM